MAKFMTRRQRAAACSAAMRAFEETAASMLARCAGAAPDLVLGFPPNADDRSGAAATQDQPERTNEKEPM